MFEWMEDGPGCVLTLALLPLAACLLAGIFCMIEPYSAVVSLEPYARRHLEEVVAGRQIPSKVYGRACRPRVPRSDPDVSGELRGAEIRQVKFERESGPGSFDTRQVVLSFEFRQPSELNWRSGTVFFTTRGSFFEQFCWAEIRLPDVPGQGR